MGRKIAAILLAGLASASHGQTWQPLDGAAIAEAITDRTVTYDDGATQRFYASGRTLYTFGEPSWGTWRVDADRYCSQWPPAPSWECYAVQGNSARGINFRDDYGNDFSGVIDQP